MTHFLFLRFLLLIFFVSPRFCLDPSDSIALSQISKELGLHLLRGRIPCESAGISCERRMLNGSLSFRITRLVFESQFLDGKISPAIGQLSELKELFLTNNQLMDQIPSQIIHCQKLEVLNLRNNQFSGEIPAGLSSLTRLRVLDLSANKFSGNLKFLKYFPNLERLNLAENLFEGEVSLSFQSFPNLRYFNFSGNSLLKDPSPLPFTEQLNEEFVYYPKRRVFAESSQRRNQISPAVSQALAPAPFVASPYMSKKKRSKIVSWILGFAVGGMAGCGSGVVFSLLFKFIMYLIKRRKSTGLKFFCPLIKDPQDLAFLASDDLSCLEVIGRGGCGEVYKAVLPRSNGKEFAIAIKKVVQPPVDADNLVEEDSRGLNKKMKQIRSEIMTVGRIRHRNLLPLVAHLPKLDCHYLVYEYMKNGSLQDYLFQVAEGKRELDWLARYKIALGVACGLEYLHLSQSPRIIHRDLKPGNILIDDEMEARITDFGLAKTVPDGHTHVTGTSVAGTYGYISPEYHQTAKFTDKCDIFSFGVVLGVLVIGKFPCDEYFQDTNELSLVKWMRNTITSENPTEAIDPKLLGNGYEEQMLLVLKVACFCTRDNPKDRPNSQEIRRMLTQIHH